MNLETKQTAKLNYKPKPQIRKTKEKSETVFNLLIFGFIAFFFVVIARLFYLILTTI